MFDAAEPSRWDGPSSWQETVSETLAYLSRAQQLLEHLERTVVSAPGGLTFVEVDDAVRCVSRAVLALGADFPGPSPFKNKRM
jgi:hypothetical protein